MKSKVHAEPAATILQDVQKREPRDRGELIASDCDLLSFMDDVHVVPDLATGDDLMAGFGIAALEVRESLTRKNYSPAESVVRSVPFQQSDFVARVQTFHQDREVKT
jgi:hypothetical protein